MKTGNDKIIDLFFQYFSGQVASIYAGDFSGSPNVYKRLLLCCVFDALAKTAFPTVAGNRERFTRLIREYGAWPYCEKVSLPRLRKLLSLPGAVNEPAFVDVRTFVGNLPQESNQCVICSEVDPDFSDIDKLWPKQNGEPNKLKVKGKPLWAKSIRHDHLFYEFRNNLIHEFNADETLGFPIHAEPFYLGGRMHYTTEFIKTLLVDVMRKLEQHLKSHDINPRDSFSYELL